MIYLLDTNICIFASKKNHPIVEILKKKSSDDLRISSITLAEIYYGVQKSIRKLENELYCDEFFSQFEILDFDRAAAKEYGLIRTHLERSGQMIGERDCQIASIARANKLAVVTNNIREFVRVPDLIIENWS